MDEFLRLNYFNITYSVEALAAITGLICFNKYKKTAIKYFIPFVIYAVLVDVMGSYPMFFAHFSVYHIIQGTLFEKNYLYFAVFWGIGTAVFYVFFYRKILRNKRRKQFLGYTVLVFLFLAILDLVLNIDNLESTHNIYVGGSLLILLCVGLYFIEILESDKVLTFYKSIYFWISCVILIWFLITTPLQFYEIYFSSADWNFIFLKWQIFLFANSFMYLSFTFALLWCKPQNA
ncbi:hypothetical protein BXY82_1909 [Gelidibacter sediminis]|uniref:Uncharacterized protein n=1 Tax=Gelidibacter sediminis TaxID=1608710 RepID=A0A4R7PY19_9FLAO|nr:hypothetical protein [Gelidibacter sediminis]TDU39874.1 hypothetical protein BXY82_1909 [Gelidibacter sediminis]